MSVDTGQGSTEVGDDLGATAPEPLSDEGSEHPCGCEDGPEASDQERLHDEIRATEALAARSSNAWVRASAPEVATLKDITERMPSRPVHGSLRLLLLAARIVLRRYFGANDEPSGEEESETSETQNEQNDEADR
jgi:hypothetical protein